jgi:hypothetical protein
MDEESLLEHGLQAVSRPSRERGIGWGDIQTVRLLVRNAEQSAVKQHKTLDNKKNPCRPKALRAIYYYIHAQENECAIAKQQFKI